MKNGNGSEKDLDKDRIPSETVDDVLVFLNNQLIESSTACSNPDEEVHDVILTGNEVDKNISQDIDSEQQSNEATFECSECKEICYSILEFIFHKKSNETCKTMQCELCDRVFNRKDSVVQHYTTHSEEKPYKCSQCVRCFKRKSTLDLHEVTHSGVRPYCCEICEKSFHLKSGLQGHMRTHLMEKTFKCHLCPKSYAHKNGIFRHMKLHKGERKHICNKCQKSFTDRDGLFRHMQTHLHASQRKFPCPHCEKGFTLRHDLKLHLCTHTGERPLACNICGARFIKTNVLKKHMEIHKKPIPYPCGHCNLIFACIEDLKIHREQGCGGDIKVPENLSSEVPEPSTVDSVLAPNNEAIINDALSHLMTMIKEDTSGNFDKFNSSFMLKGKEPNMDDRVNIIASSLLNKIVSVNQLEIGQEDLQEVDVDGTRKMKSVRVKLPAFKNKKKKPRKFIIIKEIID